MRASKAEIRAAHAADRKTGTDWWGKMRGNAVKPQSGGKSSGKSNVGRGKMSKMLAAAKRIIAGKGSGWDLGKFMKGDKFGMGRMPKCRVGKNRGGCL